MKIQSLINGLSKAGFPALEPNSESNMYQAKGKKYLCEFYNQNGDAICISIRRHNDESDTMTDYHSGFFVKTIREAVQWLQKVG